MPALRQPSSRTFSYLINYSCYLRMAGGANGQLSTRATRTMLRCSKHRGAPRRGDAAPDLGRWMGMRPMNALTSKDQLTFSLGNVSYVDYAHDEPPAIVDEPRKHGIREWLSRRG